MYVLMSQGVREQNQENKMWTYTKCKYGKCPEISLQIW